MNKQKIFYFCSLIAAFLFLFVTIAFLYHYAKESQNEIVGKKREILGLGVKGRYEETEEVFQSLEQIRAQDKKTFTIEGELTRAIPEGQKVTFFLYREKVTLELGGEIVFESTDHRGTRWEFYDSEGWEAGTPIRIMIEGTKEKHNGINYQNTLENLYCSSVFDLLWKLVHDHIGMFLLCIVTWLAGSVFLVHALLYPFMGIARERGMIPCSVFMCIAATCGIVDSKEFPLIYSNPEMIHLIEVTLQVMCMISLLGYLHTLVKSNFWKMLLNVLIFTGEICLMFEYYAKDTHQRQFAFTAEWNMLYHLVVAFFVIIIVIVELKLERSKREIICMTSSVWMILVLVAEIHFFVIKGEYHITSLVVGAVLFTCVQVLLAWKDKMEKNQMLQKAEAMKKELLENRISQLSSQIRPHFVYNMLTTIAALISMDQEKAENATIEFAEYLRGNVDAMNSEKWLPFEKELEQLHHYLKLEQFRFAGKFEWIEEIETKGFMLPAFSVEPLVENAIKHCIGMKNEILVVKLTVTRQGEDILIVVEDNGQGFDPEEKKEDGRSHMGIINVRQRIELIAHGSFWIESVPGQGTKTFIKLKPI